VSQIRRYLVTHLSSVRWKRVLQFVSTAGVLAYLLATADSRQALRLASTLSWQPLALLAAITAAEYGTRFLGLYVLLNRSRQVPVSTVAAIDLAAKFVNLVVPSRLGGEAVRPLLIRHHTDLDWPTATAIPLFVAGMTAMLTGVTTLFGVWSVGTRLSLGLRTVLLLSGLGYCAVGAGVLGAGTRLQASDRLHRFLGATIESVPTVGEWLSRKITTTLATVGRAAVPLRKIATERGAVAAVAASWAGTVMLLPAARVWVLFTALGYSFDSLFVLPVALVTAYSVTLLPLTPGGIGVSEASAVLVLSALGVPTAVAGVAVSLDRLLGVYTPALLGWVPFSTTAIDELVDRVEDR
jgi:uncharacterized protein (TIRG00374 family)